MFNNNTNLLPFIEIAPDQSAQKSIIWLHGLGADGNDFVPIVSELNLPTSMPVRFIFPHAPIIPVTINNYYQMRAWFDIESLTFDTDIDKLGITKSKQAVEKLIAHEEERGIDSRNIVLAGFSQGAVMALTTGLLYSKPLAGIIALSGCLPLAKEVIKEANSANHSTPIFMGHGNEDPIVACALGKTAYEALKQANYAVEWHNYSMAHSVCPQEIKDISRWLQAVWNK